MSFTVTFGPWLFVPFLAISIGFWAGVYFAQELDDKSAGLLPFLIGIVVAAMCFVTRYMP